MAWIEDFNKIEYFVMIGLKIKFIDNKKDGLETSAEWVNDVINPLWKMNIV